MPITGTLTALQTSFTFSRAVGKILGPETPPFLFAKNGFPVFLSLINSGPTVFIADIASAPAFSTALAISPILSTLGDNLTIIGTEVFSLTVSVTLAETLASVPKGFPNSDSTLGHYILTSIKSGLAKEIFLACFPVFIPKTLCVILLMLL